MTVVTDGRVDCDVLVIGAGPAGLACAIEVLERSGKRVVVLEQGRSALQRRCPVHLSGRCPPCGVCDVMSGVGGASGAQGGKLCFFPAGARMAAHVGMSPDEANDAVLAFLERAGRYSFLQPIWRPMKSQRLPESIGSSVTLKEYHAVPVFRSQMVRLFADLERQLLESGATLRTRAQVTEIVPGGSGVRFTVRYRCAGQSHELTVRDSIIIATGRSSASWLADQFVALGVPFSEVNVDVGVRLEMPEWSVRDFLPQLEDPKLKLNEGAPDEVRTLCWCRGGSVSVTSVEGLHLADGHFDEVFTPLTSVSVVARLPVPPGVLPLETALAHLRLPPETQGPLCQDLLQFMGSRVSPANAGMPPVPFTHDRYPVDKALSRSLKAQIHGMLTIMDDMSGGAFFGQGSGRVFGPVIDNFWVCPQLDQDLMTAVPGLYVVGDVTGLGRGIIQALFAGIVAARSILGVEAADHAASVDAFGDSGFCV